MKTIFTSEHLFFMHCIQFILTYIKQTIVHREGRVSMAVRPICR